MKLSLHDIARWSAAELQPASLPSGAISDGEPHTFSATGYSIDSRTLQRGDLFFAIRGERFDGHDFVAAALEHGACAAVVARNRLADLPEAVRQQVLLVVDDPLAALQRLASAVRRHWGKRVIGITGSAGKTTTKEAVAAVLARRFRVLKSQGNLNNHYGLPLQLLRLQPEHDVAVIEMGMSAAGEIAALGRIAAPDWGVVTNVGNAHAQNFPDGIAGIARAKYELIASLPAEGVAFLNGDDSRVSQFGRDFPGKVVSFGRCAPCNVRAEKIESLGAGGMRVQAQAGGTRGLLHLRLLGEHNVANALAAIAVGLEAGVSLADASATLEQLEPPDKRGQVLEIRGATVINDSYNCNPAALRAMIAVLRDMPARRRILVAGEMLELGPESAALHAACGRAAAEAGIDLVIGVRGNAAHIVEEARTSGADALFLETPEAAGAWLREHLHPGDAVLLKASRGVRLERALDGLVPQEKDPGSQKPAV
jgi:UDP-N-acetylmuramoyl-tripeptide--D-alanyl-D-alanine ligase